MKADEFHEWASSLPGDGNLKALARLSELRNQNNSGLTGELYRAMMEQNRDQVRREFEDRLELAPDFTPPKLENHELKEIELSNARIELIPTDQIINPNATFTIEKMNIPHAARMMNQFRVEEGAEGTRKHFVSTGKVMCWCNCGETTEWLDVLTETQKIQDWFSKHDGIKEELGLRFYYWIGELAGYSIEISHDNYGGLETELVHRCGWRKELPIDADKLLTNIVMEAQSNGHICKEI